MYARANSRTAGEIRASLALGLVTTLLVACGGGGGSSSNGSGAGTTAPPTTAPTPPANRAPTIAGTAPASVTAGQPYSFQPTASDPDGQALSFSISGKPAWATFDAATGRLSGTPATSDAGASPGIVISVSDGQTSASLAPFSIAVTVASVGIAELQWTAPTQNEDGTALTNLAGYKVRYGPSVGTLTEVVNIAGPANTRVTIEGLATGTWYFTVASYTNAGLESAQTAAVAKTIS